MQVVSHTLTCRVERGGPVLVSFFGNLGLGEVAPREIAQGSKVHVASLLDVAGTKALTVQQRAQARDYVDIDALIGMALISRKCWQPERPSTGAVSIR